MKNNKDDLDKEIQRLIDGGALELSGIDEKTGEFLFRFTDKMKDFHKDLYVAHKNEVHKDVMYFWERGFIELDDFFTDNPVISMSTKCFDEEALLTLPEDRRAQLLDIIKAIIQK